MSGYKYPNIDSGATPIGSAGRAPDRKSISRKNLTRREKELKNYFKKSEEEKFESIVGDKHQRHRLDISLPSGVHIQEPEDFRKSKNQSRRLTKLKFEEVEV
jgi:hypothetical protein